MDSMPLVSVIMPVYNVEPFLEEAVGSIIKQKYQNWELILVDDGSTDNSSRICDELAQEDRRIKVIHQRNQGLSGARNRGIKEGKGKYIIFIDSDDYLSEEMLKETIQVAEELELHCVLYEGIGFDAETGQEKAWGKRESRKVYEGRRDAREALLAMLLNKEYNPSACAYLLNTQILKVNDLSFYPGILHEDELFTVRMLLNCNNIGILHEQYYHRRIRSNSIMTDNGNLAAKGQGLITVLCELAALYTEYRKDGIEGEILDIRLKEIFARIMTLYIQSNRETRCAMKADMKKCVKTVRSLKRKWTQEKEIRHWCGRYEILSLYYDWRVAPKMKSTDRNEKNHE